MIDGVEPRRVVLAPSAYNPSLGGVEEVAARLATRFESDGCDVLVSTMRWPKSLPSKATVDGVRVARRVFRNSETPGWRGALARVDEPFAVASLVARYRRFQPDVVNIHCVSNAARFEARAAEILGIPLVVTLHGELTMDATGVFQRSERLRGSLRHLLSTADAITACSHATLREAEDWYGGGLGDRTSVIHNGVDLTEFRNAAPMQRPRPYVFAIGRLVENKGFDVLIDAFARLTRNSDCDMDLIIAGDGPTRNALQRRVFEVGLSDQVHLLGRTDRVTTANWFKGAAVFVLPSRHEPFGIVSLEAMAAGVPVVATAVGGVPELVVDGECGVLVPSESPEMLAGAIARLLDDDKLRSRLVVGGMARAECSDWSGVAEKYSKVYRDAIGYARGRSPRAALPIARSQGFPNDV